MTVKMQGPDNHGGFSHDGESYTPDADGFIDVPHAALDDAFAHGFSVAPEAEKKAADKPEKKTAGKKDE